MKGQAHKKTSGLYSNKQTYLIINNDINKSIYNSTHFQCHTTARQCGILTSVCNPETNKIKAMQTIYTYQSSKFPKKSSQEGNQHIMVMFKIDSNTIWWKGQETTYLERWFALIKFK